MSTPVPRQPLDPVHPTLQQLDELDALMKRMLALPVNAVGEDRELEDRVARLQQIREQNEIIEAAVGTLTSPVSSNVNEDLAVWDSGDKPSSAEPPSLAAEFATFHSGPRSAQPPGIRSPRDREGTGNLLLFPLVLSNQVYDLITYLLGPLGRWLRGPQGRTLVGWTGWLLMAGALAWGILDWMGWTW